MDNIKLRLNNRLTSLDVFRGLTVACMILVNNPGNWGAIYPPLKHAAWNGCTPTDLIFPFFLFIVGVSVSFALGPKKEKTTNHAEIIFTAMRRAFIIFLLGIFLALFPTIFIDPAEAITTLRIPGVLQRIALVFFLCALLFVKTNWKTQAGILVLLLILYWALMTQIPVPGIGAPSLEKESNLGAWLDRLIFTEAHLWSQSKTWDPEGLLGTLPAVATGLLGVLTGTSIRSKKHSENKKTSYLIGAGILATLAGLLWNLSFPINKALWTSSYVLYTAGIAMIVLAILYWVIDIKGVRGFTKPFVVYGVNAITVFFLSGIVAKLLTTIKTQEGNTVKSWLFSNYFEPNFSPLNASLAYALVNVFLWLIILWWMYDRRIIIKI